MRGRQRCQDCYLPRDVCMCDEITRAACKTEVIVLRHMLERRRSSNTGRLVAAALVGARVLDYAVPDSTLDISALLGPGTALLYPKPGAKAARVPRRILVLDASWSQARRMAHRIPELRQLPTLSLPQPATALPRMRAGRTPEQMSTAESVVAALRVLGDTAAADHLERLLRELVRRFALPKRQAPMVRGPQ